MADIQSEIERAQLSVKTDSYSMSFGELSTMYTDEDLIIQPDFQRLFRWNIEQKSRFIESILLGIPIPSIFVYETPDGKWELVDGLQRTSTILEFQGLLRNPDTGELAPPSILVGTRYLPGLQNVTWDKLPKVRGGSAEASPIGRPLQLAIRRSRIDIKILKRPSDARSKYDLFQRLNSGGSVANPQELRNCAVVMADPEAYSRLRQMSRYDAFASLVQFDDDQRKAQRDIEYLMRFIVYRYVPYDGKKDVEEYITDGIIDVVDKKVLDQGTEDNFRTTFDLLHRAIGEDALKHFDGGEFRGRVGLTALEVVAVGISFNLDAILRMKSADRYVRDRVKKVWSDEDVRRFSRAGLRGTQRIQSSIPFGRRWFAG